MFADNAMFADTQSRQSKMAGAGAKTLISSAMLAVDSLVLVWVRFATAVAFYVWADGYLTDEKYKLLFLDARYFFKYDGFHWVRMWPGDGIFWHFVVTKIAAIGLGLGLLTRLSAMTLAASIAYVLLVDCQLYVNHYYLLSITAVLLAFLPAGSRWSLDAKLGIERPRTTFARWQLWLLRFQLGIPYFFGAIAKLNGDWFRGQPAESILRRQADSLGVTWSEVPGLIDLFAIGGFAYDLLIVPALLWRRTRVIGVCFSVLFHVTNAITLDIGVFPWFMLATLVVFFPPQTLDRRFRLMIGQGFASEAAASDSIASLSPTAWQSSTWVHRLGFRIAIVYVLVHLLLPLRPAIYPGDSNWNERGHRFAWRMMLRHKEALTHFLVVDKNSDDFLFVPSTTVLTGNQSHRADHHPEMIRQTAIAISQAATELGVRENRVYALALVSMNGRRPKPIVDPTIDLTEVQRGWWRDDWVDQDPGPFLDSPWTISKEQWWTAIELPDPFKPLQGHTPAELQAYLKRTGDARRAEMNSEMNSEGDTD